MCGIQVICSHSVSLAGMSLQLHPLALSLRLRGLRLLFCRSMPVTHSAQALSAQHLFWCVSPIDCISGINRRVASFEGVEAEFLLWTAKQRSMVSTHTVHACSCLLLHPWWRDSFILGSHLAVAETQVRPAAFVMTAACLCQILPLAAQLYSPGTVLTMPLLSAF